MNPRLTGRLFLLVLVGSLPMVALVAMSDSMATGMSSFGIGTVRLAVVALSLAWAAVVAVFGGAYVAGDVSAAIRTPERRADMAGDTALGRLGDLLRRRDHQLHRLAAFAATAPVTEGPSAVANHVVRMAREVTGDGTWVLAIHGDGEQPEPGVYDGDSPTPASLSDLHRWGIVTGADAKDGPTVASGPWGAFLLLHLSERAGYRGQLLAPWEGRQDPSGADRSLLTLIAQHAGVTVHHSFLYTRVEAQATELRRLSSVQRDFLRGVTHDLQSPLASIGATAAELREKPELARSREELGIIEAQAERLRRMVTQLLTMSGLEAGAIQPRNEVFRVGPIIDRVIASIRRPHGAITHTSHGPDRLAVGDPDRVEQMLWALVDNAIKYSPADRPIELSTTVVEGPGGTFEEICVTDHGIGMDAKTQERAFDQFYRSEAARRVAPNGSGIGLFTARGLVALMDGSIRVESAMGVGTHVRVRLPAELVDAPGPEPA